MKFDATKDYFAELKSDEIWENDNGKQFVYLKGLQRLARERGILKLESTPFKAPTELAPIAVVTVGYTFKDGILYEGSADASPKAHKKPFCYHLTAVAESKAEARCLRRAFGIRQMSFEEVGSTGDIEDNTDKEPITDTQIRGIKHVAGLKKLEISDVLSMIKKNNLTKVDELNQKEARDALKALNRYKVKNGTKATSTEKSKST